MTEKEKRVKHPTYLISFINFLLYYPKSIILIPSLLVFLIGYDVIYDFTIHFFNKFYANSVLGLPSVEHNQLEKIHSLMESSILKDFAVTKLTFTDVTTNNILNYNFFHQLHEITNEFLIKYPNMIPINPILSWNLEKLPQKAFQFNLYNIMNYNSNYLLNSFFLDDILILNHLIVGSNVLKVYIFHPKSYTDNLHRDCFEYSSNFKILKITFTENYNSLIDLVNYYLLINNYFSNMTIKLLNITMGFILVLVVLHLYVSISNLHRIRSCFGLVCGWVIEVLISCCASVKITSVLHGFNSWKLMFEPSNPFSKSTFILMVCVLSSRNLIRIINDICPDSFSSNNSTVLLKKLFEFFTGINNNTIDDPKKLHLIDSILGYCKLSSKIKIPNITKILFVNISWLFCLEMVSCIIVTSFFEGTFASFLTRKLSNFFQIIAVGVIIDHVLQITYLLGVILIDFRRSDFTKILNTTDIHMVENESNCFTNWLLKLKYNKNERPSVDSFRYKIGSYLSTVRYTTSLKSWFIVLPILQSINFLALMTWSIYIPYSLLNDENNIITHEKVNVFHDSSDIFFYLEMFLITVLLLALSALIFKFSNFQTNHVPANVMTNHFELLDTKAFKCIDLVFHQLDVIKIKSNSLSSFLITIGLDHKILIWSPLRLPTSKPIDISSNIVINGKEVEFWPINHINLSDYGDYIILINFKYKLVKCFSRLKLKFCWTKSIDDKINIKNDKILESFFREKTLPDFLRIKVFQNQQNSQSRRNSQVSMNGSFPKPLVLSIESDPQMHRFTNRTDFVLILESGQLITYSCADGEYSTFNILDKVYEDTSGLKLVSAKHIFTPRVNDRIICHMNNGDIFVMVNINNEWKFNKLNLQPDYYNREIKLLPTNAPTSINSLLRNYDFRSDNEEFTKTSNENREIQSSGTNFNKVIMEPIEFVGMMMRVNNLVAQLIDIETGIILKETTVGYFKPLTFKVSHLEPTHCRFCGCASVHSLSILYEDFYTKTVMVHTFTIPANRSKTNICLRVERDPREIRCVGFNEVKEDQYWYEDIDSWELNHINMLIGVKRRRNEDNIEVLDNELLHSTGISSGFSSIKSRRSKSMNLNKKEKPQIWEGFVLNLNDGKLIEYKMPDVDQNLAFLNSNSIERFGYKAVAINFGSIVKILYLGNDKLIEQNLFFNESNVKGTPPGNKAINNDLLFINKRRRGRGR